MPCALGHEHAIWTRGMGRGTAHPAAPAPRSPAHTRPPSPLQDVARLHAALARHFPASDPAEGSAEAAWAAAEFVAPTGTASLELLGRWGLDCFSHGAEFAAAHPALALDDLVRCAAATEAPEELLGMEAATAMHEATLRLAALAAEGSPATEG